MSTQILKIAHRKALISQRELPHKAQRAQNKDPYARPTPDGFRSQLGLGESWGKAQQAAPTACNQKRWLPLKDMTNDHPAISLLDEETGLEK